MNEKLKESHDLRLPDWGPYSKKYAGISHISDPDQGLRFDLSVFPGFYRRKIELPNCMFETNYHIWNAAADLSFYETRHELEWKDKVYCDVSYAAYDKDTYLINTRCVNNTDEVQNLVLHYLASIQYAAISNCNQKTEIPVIDYHRPEKSEFVPAIDFEKFEHRIIRPTDSLVPDGLRRGEVRRAGCYRGSAVLLGEEDGDRIIYHMKLKHCYKNPVIAFRYHMVEENSGNLIIDGDIEAKVPLNVSKNFSVVFADARIKEQKELSFSILTEDTKILLDAIFLCEKEDAGQIVISDQGCDHIPVSWENGHTEPVNLEVDTMLNLIQDVSKSKEMPMLVTKYRDSEYYYGICWNYKDYVIRYLCEEELDTFLRFMAHNHVRKVLGNNKDYCYTDIFLRPVPVKPHETKDIYGAVCTGKTREEVEEKLTFILENPLIFKQTVKDKTDFTDSSENTEFSFSQNIMAATTLTNVVYPVYAKRSYIRHNTPGRWWDSLYTWDSGFTGLGLSTCDVQRAIDCLNTYTTQPGDSESAFIHHGTPLPVQFYLFQELYNKTQSKELLSYFYPRLKQYYEFLAGKLGSSDTARFKSGLLNTWSYFYNSGGWDDYPAQVATHAYHKENEITCVSTTAHVIRCAKILKLMATLTGNNEDIGDYEDEVQYLSESLQKNSWDDDSGYFGYVIHDSNLYPAGIFRYENNENYNKGLDGMSPFLASAVTKEQEKIIAGRLMNEKRFMTPIGLSTVDQSAGYYKKDGYWNGAVWMPHQWFYFKALLDYGYTDAAYEIAHRALVLWKNEVNESYNCFEHFIIASGRGAGWHHFSGLSTPVLLWYQSYYKRDTLTAGFGSMVVRREISDRRKEFELIYSDSYDKTSVIIVLEKNQSFMVLVNGRETEYMERLPGTIEISFAVTAGEKIQICCLLK